MTEPESGRYDEPKNGEAQYELVFPFVACVSQGGPYDDDSFTAGYQAGLAEQKLATAEHLGAQAVTVEPVYPDLLPQLDLIGAHYGYPVNLVVTDPQTPEWAQVTFHTTDPDTPPSRDGGAAGD